MQNSYIFYATDTDADTHIDASRDSQRNKRLAIHVWFSLLRSIGSSFQQKNEKDNDKNASNNKNIEI